MKNKVAIITGGGSGLGKAIAAALSKKGALVEICARNKKELAHACREIKDSGFFCKYSLADIRIQEDVVRFVGEVMNRQKKIDILINNAGFIFKPKPIEKITDTEYNNSFDTNIKPIFYFSKEILPIMKRRGSGIIVNITSTAGLSANSMFPIYSASKFAARGLTQSIGKSLINSGISYFSVAPAGINTKMRRYLFGDKDAEMQQKPEEVANIIVKLLLKKNGVPNGADVVIRKGKVVKIHKPE